MRPVRPARLITVEPTREAHQHGRARTDPAEAGPAPYFPSIEKKHGRSIGHWQQIIAGCGLDKHMAIAGYLKAEHGIGHSHANAFAGRALAGNPASP